ncbi:deoxyribodipyrimidine photo-lyase [Vibrio sp. vnigr-6D03]|uniref:cryptochrome/photolyase family protein n=1 Tax=Vibrio sp. vnigr-6D03 TaxID=2058088 RepID=UPI000C33AE77|nr:FAD-binding domain-containing protein [Vibrio sp. vnigr-6D03]PKF79778.1 deoxyribodipyrimidine photo-lyase [Vibrio sp. vnigr-6D03]
MQLVWFRRDLRTLDNTALSQAIATGQPVIALYIATPQQWESHHMAPIQADLIYRRLYELQRELHELNVPLVYAEVSTFAEQGDLISKLLTYDKIQGLHANIEYEWNEKQRDSSIESRCPPSKNVHLYHDKCVLPPRSVLNKKGEYFKVFTPFKRAWLNQVSLAGVSVFPRLKKGNDEVPEVTFLQPLVSQFNSKCHFSYPRTDSNQYDVCTEALIHQLREFCAESPLSSHNAFSSQNALSSEKNAFRHTKSVDRYKEDRDFPFIEGTSKLSPYLALGFLSVRQCVARLTYQQSMDDLNEGEQIWLSELVWREFYQHLLDFEPKLSKGLPFIDWAIDLEWHNDKDWFERWKNGTTGYPIVDAAMRQLNSTGWMHNRLRMIVASFLTKDLLIDWRWGEDYFLSKLADGDYAANNGGWQWSASTGCDGQPYFRIFNPISQGEKFDTQGEFVRHWIPELKQVPSKYIHQPWMWSENHTLNYPERVVDHKTQRELALSMYKKAKG